jgi:hypothetical protein
MQRRLAVVRHLLLRSFPDATRVEPEVFKSARIQAERIVFLVVAHGIVSLLPELPKAVACPVSSSRSALLSDDKQYGTPPRGSACGH